MVLSSGFAAGGSPAKPTPIPKNHSIRHIRPPKTGNPIEFPAQKWYDWQRKNEKGRSGDTRRAGRGPLMDEQGLPDGRVAGLPAGYRMIRAGKARVAVREEYAEAFSNFALPEIDGLRSDGFMSGRSRLIPIPLAGDGSERGLIRRSIRGGMLGRFLKESYLNVGRPRPLRELRISEYARASGVSTAEVAAAIVEKANALLYRGAVVTREIHPAADLEEEALSFSPQDRPGAKRRCIESLGRLIARMHGAGIYHADLHLKNVLKSGEKLYLLDLDAASLRNPLPDFKKRMNLLRLYRSTQKINRRKRVITRTDMLRFVRSYAAASNRPEEALLRGLRRMLPLWRLKWRLSDMLKI